MPKTIKNLLLLILIFLLGQLNLISLAYTITPFGPVLFVFSTLVVLLLTLYLAQKMGIVTWDWNIFKKPLIKYLILGTVVMYAGKLAGSVLLTLGQQAADNQVAVETIVQNISPIHTFLALAVVAPLTEEVVFRGGIMGLLFKNRPKLGLAVSIVAFTLAHVPTNLGSVVVYGSMAAVLAFTYHKTKRLELCIALHFINNAFAVLAMALLPMLLASA